MLNVMAVINQFLAVKSQFCAVMYQFLLAANYGENFGKWGLEQCFWVVLFLGLAAAGALIVKKNFVNAGVTVVVVAIVCFLLKNPTKVSALGTAIANILGL